MERPTAATLAACTLLAIGGPGYGSVELPSPESMLGFSPCAERSLATSEEISTYLQALAAASDRIELEAIGTTEEGRTQWLAIISSPENLRDRERYREIAERLARARDLDDEQARVLAEEGRAVVWIDFGLHSTERAHAQTAPQLAFLAVSEETEEWHRIRDEVVFLLLPDMNPDGTTLIAEWYRTQLGSPYEDSSPPRLYQKYAGHDNNRDWFMFNLAESRNVGRQLYHRWYPQIVYNQHQEAPFPARIFIPPFADPMNPNIPPLVMRGVNLVGEAMGQRFAQEGKPGAISRISFDTWWNGGMRTTPYFHNMIGILTETAHSSPASITYDREKFPKSFGGGVSTTEPSTFYPAPYLGGPWSFRDSCDYMLTASMAVLDIGASRRRSWLYDIYRMGRDAIEAGAAETYIIPAPDEQWDAGTTRRLVDVLRQGGVEVERATSRFRAGEREYPAGSFLVRGAQAFRPYLTDLLNPQVYPDRRQQPGGSPELPYDITGWTLPLQMGVAVDRHELTVEAATEPVTGAEPAPGRVAGKGDWGWALDPRANDSFTAVQRLLDVGAAVSRLDAPLRSAGIEWPPGAFVVLAPENDDGAAQELREQVERAARSLGLVAIALDAAPDGTLLPLRAPRVGLYRAWGGNMDEGWTRWVLDQFELPYQQVFDADLRAGSLRDRLDVLVLPDARWESMLHGQHRDLAPAEYTGGMTPSGVFHLYEFTRSGGTLVALDTAAELPLTIFALPVRDVTARLERSDFFVPGTLLRLLVDPAHPLAYGMPEEATGFFAHSPAFQLGREATRLERHRGIEPTPPATVTKAASWAEESDLLRSGWVLGGSHIAGKAAVVEAEVGDGRVVLLGLRAQHRGQPHGTFKLLFNALYRGTAGTQ
ncbi:MAG TPA: M14 family metallopeptidase [Thermoanaerobaculia bacterium]|nr:M14 family metallopeptidase [Thermoanaerobaculia bacterium]